MSNTSVTLTTTNPAETSAAPSLGLTAGQLTFDDEFNSFTSSPDGSSGWQTQMPYWGSLARTLPTGEIEYFSDSSVGVDPFSLSNGALTIRSAPAIPSAANNYQPNTSGLIQSRTLATQTYGYFEAGINVTSVTGLWPAFWLTSVDNTYGGEIDAAEILTGDTKQIYNTTHVLTRTGSKVATLTQVNLPTDLAVGFHSIGVDWEPDNITWYIDGVVSSRQPTAAYGLDKPMYMILCQSVGGWAGGPPTGYGSADMKIDYVRAYATANTVDVAGSGVIKAGSVAGTVKRDSGTALGGVTVTLIGATGKVAGTTTTDQAGGFSFGGLAAGSYKLRYAAPSGYVTGTGSVADAMTGLTASFSVADGQTTSIAPAIMAAGSSASIAGAVVYRPNGWTAPSPESGVAIQLLTTTFAVIASTVTDSAGNYQFSNLAAGQYVVRYVPPAYEALLAGPAPAATQKSSFIKLAAGQTYTLAPETTGPALGNFSGVVTYDPDAGGPLAAAPQSGVTVSLLDDYGNVLATTVTNSYGGYSLPSAAGWNTIKVIPPAGERVGSGADVTTGTVRALAAAGRNTVQPNINLVTANSAPGAITGSVVYLGAGLAGVAIALIDSNHQKIATATTDSAGTFSFGNLDSGSYQLQYSTAPGTSLLSGPASNVTGLTGFLQLAPGQALTLAAETLNALPASVKGNVVYGGGGLSGVFVSLRNSAGTTMSTVTTDATGAFSFGNLRVGSYSLAYTAPSGTVPQSGPANASSGTTAAFTLSGGQTLSLGQETLAAAPATAGVTGSVTAQGVGLVGVTVTLLVPATVVAPASTQTTITAANGTFSFGKLLPGSGYTLRYTLPSGGTILYGADATTGLTPAFGLAAGITRSVSTITTSNVIGSVLGSLFSGTSYAAGRTISLLDAGGSFVASVTTNAWGGFVFTGVPVGSYRVKYASLPGEAFKAGDPADATGVTAPVTVTANGKTTLAAEHLQAAPVAPVAPVTPAAPLALSLAGNGSTLTQGDGTYTVTGSPTKGSLTLGNGNQTVNFAGGNANTVTLGNGNQSVTLGGWLNIVTVGTGTSVINAGVGYNTVHAAGGNVTISATGNANLFDAGPGTDTLIVSPGSVHNSFVLNGYGQGLTTITGFSAAQYDTLTLTRTLAGISIKADLSNLGTYVKAADSPGGTTLSVDPTGGSGTPYAFAYLAGVHNVSVATLIGGHNISI